MTINVESFLVIEESLTDRLMVPWAKHATAKVTQIKKLVAQGKFNEAYRVTETLDLTTALKGNLKYVRFATMAALLYGAGRVKATKTTEVYKAGTNLEVFDPSVTMFQLMLEDAAGTLRREVRSVIAAEEKRQLETDAEVVTKAALVRDFAGDMAKAVGTNGRALVQLTSSLHTSRLSAYGYTLEAAVSGHSYFKVSEQLDIRICPVCREMHGKEFPIGDAFTRLDKQLRLDDLSTLKSTAPWPRQSKHDLSILRNMTSEEIVAKGWDTPPYHPGCRGVLIASKRRAPQGETFLPPILQNGKLPVKVPVVTAPVVNPTTVEELQQYNRYAGEAELADYVKVMGTVTPAELEASLLGGMVDEIGEGTIKSKLSIGKDQLKYSGRVIAADGDEVAYMERTFLRTTSDDYAEKLMVVKHDYLDIEPLYQGQGLAKRVLRDSMSMYKRLGVDRINLDAGLDRGGYAWAKYGFTPTQSNWDALRRRLAMDYHVSGGGEGLVGLSASGRKAMDDILTYDNPKALWTLSDIPDEVSYGGVSDKLGVHLLSGTGWSGSLSLSDVTAMRRFNRYTGAEQ
jgi:GNAT superfamily N-acetyltransferase